MQNLYLTYKLLLMMIIDDPFITKHVKFGTVIDAKPNYTCCIKHSGLKFTNDVKLYFDIICWNSTPVKILHQD
jgi:hypothetical protein